MSLMEINGQPVPFPYNLLAIPLALGILAFIAVVFIIIAALLLSPFILIGLAIWAVK